MKEPWSTWVVNPYGRMICNFFLMLEPWRTSTHSLSKGYIMHHANPLTWWECPSVRHLHMYDTCTAFAYVLFIYWIYTIYLLQLYLILQSHLYYDVCTTTVFVLPSWYIGPSPRLVNVFHSSIESSQRMGHSSHMNVFLLICNTIIVYRQFISHMNVFLLIYRTIIVLHIHQHSLLLREEFSITQSCP